MTLKTAFHLQYYWKKFKKGCNAGSTLFPVQDENKEMRRNFRGSDRSASVTMEPPQPVSQRKLLQSDSEDDNNVPNLPDDCDDYDDNECNGNRSSAEATVMKDKGAATIATVQTEELLANQYTMDPANNPSPPVKKKRKGPRCGMCGHEYKKDSEYGKYHQNMGKRCTSSCKKPSDVCTVPSELRAPGFPLEDGQPFPERKRNRVNRKRNKRHQQQPQNKQQQQH